LFEVCLLFITPVRSAAPLDMLVLIYYFPLATARALRAACCLPYIRAHKLVSLYKFFFIVIFFLHLDDA
jgi:hypothetical protein